MDQKDLELRGEFKDFIRKLEKFQDYFSSYKHEKDKISVDTSVKSVAEIYEKMRNSLGYQQEQMLRRIAIERALNRKLVNSFNPALVAKSLIKELIHSGYLQNNTIPSTKAEEVAKIIKRYFAIIEQAQPEARNYAIGIASADIENTLVVSHIYEDALEKTFLDIINKNITDENFHEALLICASAKIFKKADLATLRYHLLKYYLPSWFHANEHEARQLKPQFSQSVRHIEQTLEHDDIQFYSVIVKKFYPLFIVFKKTIDKSPENSVENFKNKNLLTSQINNATMDYYKDALSKLNRSIIKAVLFVLITKIIVGLILEIPYEIYVAKQIHYLPIAINIIFPPLLMFLSAYLISIPGSDNTQKIIELAKELVYSQKNDYIESVVEQATQARGKQESPILSGLYFVTFLIVVALISWVLISLQFNPISGFLFFLFLSTVSFLAFRIRRASNELNMVIKNESGAAGIIDFLLLPFLKIGHWLNKKFEKYNVFLYVFDFILESPFKTILEIIEQWIGYVREKKEEISS